MMIFEITIQPQDAEAERTKPLRIQAGDWFTAMREGLPKMGVTTTTEELEVTLLEDERSAVVIDSTEDRKIFVLAVDHQSQHPDETPPTAFQTDRDHIRFDSQPIPVMPTTKPDTFSLNGAYAQGATTDFLTEAFMKVGDLHGSFGDDLQGAMTHLFAMLEKATNAEGGGLLLADINDLQGRLHFAYAMGDQRDALQQEHIPSSHGAIGHACQHYTPLVIDDLQGDPRFPDDPLTLLGVPAGPTIAVPILHEQLLLGAVLLYRPQGTKPFSQGEANIFNYLSGSIAQYLHLIQPQ